MHDKEVVRELRRFFDGRRKNDGGKKSSNMEKLPSLSIGDVYRDYLRQRNPLAVCVKHYLELSRHGKTIRKHLDADSLQMYAYIKLLNRIAHKASDKILKG
jgi:hypothetical protein